MQRSALKHENEIPFSKRFIFFGRNSGIHGLGHLFRKNANFMERLFWLVILLASSGCLYLLLVPVVERSGSAVSFTPDTRYLHWNTVFPGVTVCESYVPRTVAKKLEHNYPELMKPLSYEFKRYLADLTFARGACKKSICTPCDTTVPCDLPWRKIVEDIRRPCQELLTNCSFNNKEFPCCKLFRLVDSEYGPCYSLNSLQSENPEGKPLLSVNITTGPGTLSFRVQSDAQISVHSNEEMASNYLNAKLKFDVKTYAENRVDYCFSVVAFENDRLLQSDDFNVRGCRYHYEIPDDDDDEFHTYSVYSYSHCRVARDTEHAFEHCGCVHPVRGLDYKDMYCNFTGLNCLVIYIDNLVKADKDGDRHDEKDDCLPSCVESELSTVHVSRRWDYEQQGSGVFVKIKMVTIPTLRYERNLLRSKLDLVVSVAGMVGLFFSASILSLVEIVYLLLRAPND